jgi:hypothetical protein
MGAGPGAIASTTGMTRPSSSVLTGLALGRVLPPTSMMSARRDHASAWRSAWSRSIQNLRPQRNQGSVEDTITRVMAAWC